MHLRYCLEPYVGQRLGNRPGRDAGFPLGPVRLAKNAGIGTIAPDEPVQLQFACSEFRGLGRMSNPALDIQHVEKTFGRKVRALDGVSLRVGRGEIFGLLGPNGAGKSTLVKILMTVIRPDRVAGTMLGRPIGEKRALAHVGYLPEAHRFPRYLTGRQLLDYYGALAKVRRSERRVRAGYWLERVGLAEWGSTKVSKYSKGMLQRLGLAQAMMNDPELVFLDEPTDGLDPMGRRDVRELLVDMRGQGKTVFLNSHLLSELEMVCSRAVILDRGKIVKEGTLEELTEKKLEVRITTAGPLDGLAAEIEQQGGQVEGARVTISGRDDRKVNAMIDLLRAKGILIQAVEPARVSLEDVFLEAVGHATPAARPVAGSPPTRARA